MLYKHRWSSGSEYKITICRGFKPGRAPMDFIIRRKLKVREETGMSWTLKFENTCQSSAQKERRRVIISQHWFVVAVESDRTPAPIPEQFAVLIGNSVGGS